MFEQVFNNLRTATEANIHMQQELIKKWMGMWPGVPGVAKEGCENVQKVQKKLTDYTTDVVKKQRENLEAQFSAGLKNIEDAFRLVEAKDPEQLRTKTVELWQKTFDFVRQTYETQIRDFQSAVVKWTELMTKVPGAKAST